MFSSPLKETQYPLAVTPRFSLPPTLATTSLLCVYELACSGRLIYVESDNMSDFFFLSGVQGSSTSYLCHHLTPCSDRVLLHCMPDRALCIQQWMKPKLL